MERPIGQAAWDQGGPAICAAASMACLHALTAPSLVPHRHKDSFKAAFREVYGTDTHIDVVEHHGSTGGLRDGVHGGVSVPCSSPA